MDRPRGLADDYVTTNLNLQSTNTSRYRDTTNYDLASSPGSRRRRSTSRRHGGARGRLRVHCLDHRSRRRRPSYRILCLGVDSIMEIDGGELGGERRRVADVVAESERCVCLFAEVTPRAPTKQKTLGSRLGSLY